MYPIRIFGIRVPPDGHFECALYDDAAREDGRETVTCFASLGELAVHVARMLFETDPDTVMLCIRQPEHLLNLLAFKAKPSVRGFRGVANPETKRCSADEQVTFLKYLYAELRAVESETKE